MSLQEIARNHYYHLHQYPELSCLEYQTTEYIIEQLNELGGFDLDTRTDTGLIATYNPGCKTTIAFRADIDALPIEEKTGLEYASKNTGVMHACGHDFHTANLLAFAHHLKNVDLHITVKLIFQANEETTPGGSKKLIDNHGLDDVDYFFGIHVDPGYPKDMILIKSGALYASIDDFFVTVKGVGGHVSTPHLVNDPMPCAVSIVNDLMNGIHKRIDPMNQPLIGITTFQCGQGAYNIIANDATFNGTIRTHNNDTRQKSIAYFNQFVRNTAKAYGLDVQIDWLFGEPPLINSEALVKEIQPYLTQKMPGTIHTLDTANFGGEDFSNYANLKPSIFFMVGVHVNDADFHNENFQVDLGAFSYSLDLYEHLVNYYNNEDI